MEYNRAGDKKIVKRTKKKKKSARSLERYGLGGAVSFDLHSIPPTFGGCLLFPSEAAEE